MLLQRCIDDLQARLDDLDEVDHPSRRPPGPDRLEDPPPPPPRLPIQPNSLLLLLLLLLLLSKQLLLLLLLQVAAPVAAWAAPVAAWAAPVASAVQISAVQISAVQRCSEDSQGSLVKLSRQLLANTYPAEHALHDR
jgi:hypothetical protein